MVRLDKLLNAAVIDIVKKVIDEPINKTWLKDILLGKKYHASHYFRETSEAEFFEICIWDNLTKEQQDKVIESINLLIEEDILIEKQPGGNYCFYLLDLAIILENKLPGKINSKPFMIWKEGNFSNISEPEKIDHPVRKCLAQAINQTFTKTNYTNPHN